MPAIIKIEQVGLAQPGVPGQSRTDGLDNGAQVTLDASAYVGATTVDFRFLWHPPGDTNSVASLTQTGTPEIWTFNPTPLQYGSWRVELIIDEGLPTEIRERRTFGVRTPVLGLLIPALNEVANPDASLVNNSPLRVMESENNEPFGPFIAGSYAGWWPAFEKLCLELEALAAGGTGGGSITVKDEGGDITTALASLNFVGTGVTATALGDDVTVTISGGGGGGSDLEVLDEGGSLTTTAMSINFEGPDVTATTIGDDVTVSINSLQPPQFAGLPFVEATADGLSDTLSVDLTGLPGDVKDLKVVATVRSDSGGLDYAEITFNGDTSGVYDASFAQVDANGNLVGSSDDGINKSFIRGPAIVDSGAPANVFGTIEFTVDSPFDATKFKSVTGSGYVSNGAAVAQQKRGLFGGTWRNLASINSIEFKTFAGGNLVAGTQIRVYGMGTTAAGSSAHGYLEAVADGSSDTLSVDVTALGGNVEDFLIVSSARSQAAVVADLAYIRFNNDNGTNYDSAYRFYNGATTVAGTGFDGPATDRIRVANIPGASAPVDKWGFNRITVTGFRDTSRQPNLEGHGGSSVGDNTETEQGAAFFTGNWRNTSDITSVQITTNGPELLQAGSYLRIYPLGLSTGGSSMVVKDENATITTGAKTLNFKGAGVQAKALPNDEVEVLVEPNGLPFVEVKGDGVATELTVDLSGFPVDARDLFITWSARGVVASGFIESWIRMNGDTGTNYNSATYNRNADTAFQSSGGDGASKTWASLSQINGNNAPAGSTGSGSFTVTDHNNPNRFTSWSGTAFISSDDTNAGTKVADFAGMWKNTAPVTSITFGSNIGAFDDETYFRVYALGSSGYGIGQGAPAFVEVVADGSSDTLDVNVSSLAVNYSDLRVQGSLRGSTVTTYAQIRLNGDLGANYDSAWFSYDAAGALADAAAVDGIDRTFIRGPSAPFSTSPANSFSSFDFTIPEAFNTSKNKTLNGEAFSVAGGTEADLRKQSFGGMWKNTGAIQTLQIRSDSGNWDAGSVIRVYGVTGSFVASQDFGADFKAQLDKRQRNTIFSTPQVAQTMTVNVSSPGWYRAGWSYQWSYNTTGAKINVGCRIDGVDLIDSALFNLDAVEPKDVTDRDIKSQFGYTFLLPGPHTVELTYASSNGVATATLAYSRLEFWRVTAPEEVIS